MTDDPISEGHRLHGRIERGAEIAVLGSLDDEVRALSGRFSVVRLVRSPRLERGAGIFPATLSASIAAFASQKRFVAWRRCDPLLSFRPSSGERRGPGPQVAEMPVRSTARTWKSCLLYAC
jgi:hypothetical protein